MPFKFYLKYLAVPGTCTGLGCWVQDTAEVQIQHLREFLTLGRLLACKWIDLEPPLSKLILIAFF